MFEAAENPLSRLRERVRVRGGRLSEHALALLERGRNYPHPSPLPQAGEGERPMTAPLLDVQDFSVFYDRFQAVHGVNVNLNAGEIVSIIGANGAGKSSFLKALVGQGGRSTGKALFEGRDLATLVTRDIVKHGVALVPEGRKLFPSLTVFENLRLGWELGRQGEIDTGYDLQLVPDPLRAAGTAGARLVGRATTDGGARPRAARQPQALAVRRDQPRPRRRASSTSSMKNHPEDTRPRRRRHRRRAGHHAARSPSPIASTASSRARCRSPASRATSTRAATCRHYFGA